MKQFNSQENHAPSSELKSANEKENAAKSPQLKLLIKGDKRKTHSEPNLQTLLQRPLSPKRQHAQISHHHPLSPRRKRKCKRIHRFDISIVKTNCEILKEFIQTTSKFRTKDIESIAELLLKISEIEIISAKVVQALQAISRYYLHQYDINIDSHIAARSLASCMINFYDPTLTGHPSYEAAMSSLSCSNQMSVSLTQLIKILDQQCENNEGSPSIRSNTIQCLADCAQLQDIAATHFMDYTKKVKTTKILTKKSALINYTMQKRLIENNPELEPRDHFKRISEKESEIEKELHNYLSIEEKEEIEALKKQVFLSELPYTGTSKLEKIHDAAIEPLTLLGQFNNDGYEELKIKLLIEIAEENSGYQLLYKSLTHMRSMLIDLAPRDKEGDIFEKINIAELIHHVAESHEGATEIFKIQFNYIRKILEESLLPHEIKEFNEKINTVMLRATVTEYVLVTLPDSIILTLKTINQIEKRRLLNVLKRIPEIIRQDMLNLESNQYSLLLKENRLTFDQTENWISQLFKSASALNLTEAEIYSAHNYRHLLEAGLLTLIQHDSINRQELPDTLFTDYHSLLNMQKKRQELILKCVIYYTLLTFIQKTVTVTSSIKSNLQEIINNTFAQYPIQSSQFINALLYLVKRSLFNDHNIYSLVLSDNTLTRVIKEHIKPTHRLFQLFQKRINRIISHTIHKGIVDLSILKSTDINLLTNNFQITIEPKLTTMINNHLFLHAKTYKSIININIVNSFLKKLKKLIYQPDSTLSPYFNHIEPAFKLYSLRFNKITLCATLMSLTQQFANNIDTPINNDVSDQDIEEHIKQTNADILFKRRNYTKEQIIQHIIEYRALPLLNKVNINLHIIFHHLEKKLFLSLIADNTTQLGDIKERYLLHIPELFQQHQIPLKRNDHITLKSMIRQIEPDTHPGLTIYQDACHAIFRRYLLTRKLDIVHKRKWAALHLFQPIIKQLCYDASSLLHEIKKRATLLDSGNQFANLPSTTLRTGRSRL